MAKSRPIPSDTPRVRRRGLYTFLEFLRPDSFWPHPYSLEQAVGVLQWMVKTGAPFQKHGSPSVYELLSKNPTCINMREVKQITSLADLQSRFHHALLSRYASPLAEDWKKSCEIDVDCSVWITFPHYVPMNGPVSEAETCKIFDRLLTEEGRLTVQLNSCWNQARNFKGVDLHIDPVGVRFNLRYGFDGSEWNHILAMNTPGEPFYDTMMRARKALDDLTDPIHEQHSQKENANALEG